MSQFKTKMTPTRLFECFFKLLGINAYSRDGLISVHNHDFMTDSAFMQAYNRGLLADGVDYRFQWRVHVALWAATHCSKLEGDFVECGVNRGFMSSAIMSFLDWNRTGKTYYLLDTFSGPDAAQLNEDERQAGYVGRSRSARKAGFYQTDIQTVTKNFSEWTNVRIIAGRIPETLASVTSEKIGFVHIDLNCSAPEIAALSFFWRKLVSGALVLLDDYAYVGFGPSKQAMDSLMKEKGVKILSLPTGQGLLIVP